MGINLAKDVLHVYTENFKTMLTVIKGNLNKGELCVVHGRKTQYCCNVTSVQIDLYIDMVNTIPTKVTIALLREQLVL